MNYISQLNGFWNWRKLNEVSHVQTDLYFAILDCGNTARWKETFNIPNSTLERMCQISKTELHKQRNRLVQLGLIRYNNGKKGTAGTYTIIPLYETHMDIHIDTDVAANMRTHMNIHAGNIHKQDKIKHKELVFKNKKDSLITMDEMARRCAKQSDERVRLAKVMELF